MIFPLSYSSGTSSSFFTGAASVPQFPSLGSAVGKGASGLLPQSHVRYASPSPSKIHCLWGLAGRQALPLGSAGLEPQSLSLRL